MRQLLAITILLVGGAFARADHYVLQSSGHYANSAGALFTRTQYYQPGYAGCCGYYYYSYTPYYAPAATYTAPATPAYTDSGWRTKLIDGVLKERSNALEQQYYMDAITAFGLKGAVPLNGYYASHTYTQTVSPFFAAQGSTVYGYANSNNVTAYGEVDVNATIQAYARAVERTQTLSGTAVSDLGALTDQELQRRLKYLEGVARLQEIRAKGDVAVAVMRAIEEKKIVIQNNGSGFTTSPPGSFTNPIPPSNTGSPIAPRDDRLDRLESVMATKCAACHSGSNIKGNLDLTLYKSFDLKRLTSIYARVIEQDPTKRMPQSEKGGPGEPLPPAEAILFAPPQQQLR